MHFPLSTALLSLSLLLPTLANPLLSSPSPSPSPRATPVPLDTTPIIHGLHIRAPQTTCAPNSGTDNTGCGNSGTGNSGTGNSGICLSGTGESGVGDCSNAAEAVATSVYVLQTATTIYLVSTVTVEGNSVVTTVQSVFAAGATATQTIVVDDGRYSRPGCAYWRTQGYICSAAGRGVEVSRLAAAVVGVVGLAVML
ncbi:uncharacterized protein LAJ45_01802 [Morchella importuna]|uniref:uncharacterized protein n=1 Tax=Morchella importuna TaxID=1174673 RepID=UPI001E8D3910|nr:uncharacterized protein LAJ45_01802 [Morchella importuna]KAH8154035.1 hypothetical protein LAJ45_01802 [Morchella importuna]